MRKSEGKRKIVFDLLLIAVLLLVSLSVYFVFNAVTEAGSVVRVYKGNRVVAEYPLSVDGEYSVGDGNVIRIENGEAYMASADCPDKWCMYQGKICDVGERVTCLPNKVMFEIVK